MGKHIVVIGGSVQENSFTMQAAALIEDELSLQKEITYEVIDPKVLSLSLPGGGPSPSADALQKSVEKATGVILVSPEYHGGISSVLKLIIDNLGFPSVLGAKPIALLGVAAGVIGAIKSLEMTRSICSHVGAIVLPGPVSLSNVRDVFDEKGQCTDERIEKRVRGVVTNLLHYIDQNICPRIALENMVREQV